MPITAPGQIVPAQGTGVVLELDHVEPTPAQDHQVHLVPLALPIPKLKVRPRPEGRVRRQQGPDDIEPLGLVRELRGSHLNPALDQLPHSAVSFIPARTYPASSLPRMPSCQPSLVMIAQSFKCAGTVIGASQGHEASSHQVGQPQCLAAYSCKTFQRRGRCTSRPQLSTSHPHNRRPVKMTTVAGISPDPGPYL